MRLRRLLSLVLCGTTFAAGPPTFKNHQIGEPAEHFFRAATMEDGRSALDYCRDKPTIKGKAISASEAVYCARILDAVAGKDAAVALKVSGAPSPGEFVFHAGALVRIRFEVIDLFGSVVSDVKSKLSDEEPQIEESIVQNQYGARSTERTATWKSPSLIVQVYEFGTFSGGMQNRVVVSDPRWSEEHDRQLQTRRKNSLD